MDAVEGLDLLGPGIPESVREVDLPKVNVKGPTPDTDPLEVLEGAAAGQGEDQVLLAVRLNAGMVGIRR